MTGLTSPLHRAVTICCLVGSLQGKRQRPPRSAGGRRCGRPPGAQCRRCGSRARTQDGGRRAAPPGRDRASRRRPGRGGWRTTSSSSSRAGSRKSTLERRTTKTRPLSLRSRSWPMPQPAQHLGARPLGEFEVVGVVDHAAGIGVLVIDADGIAVDAVGDGALGAAEPVMRPSSSAASSARRSSCAARGRSGFSSEIGDRPDRSSRRPRGVRCTSPCWIR